MLKRTLFLFVLALMFGCGDDTYSRVAGQSQAEKLVWYGLYEQTMEPPQIKWVFQKDLDCADDPENNQLPQGFIFTNPYDGTKGFCVGGVYWNAFYYAEVAWPDDVSFIWQTSWSHENLHSMLNHKYGYGDPMHLDPSWGIQFGNEYGLLDEANDILKQAGL